MQDATTRVVRNIECELKSILCQAAEAAPDAKPSEEIVFLEDSSDEDISLNRE